MLNVTVVRSKWFRGKDFTISRLRSPSGKQCCVGFLAKALGATDQEITHLSTLDEVQQTACRGFCKAHPAMLVEAYIVNDTPATGDSNREKRLITIGLRMGVQFTFVD